MKGKISFLSVLAACILTLILASSGLCAGTENRPTISDAERAVAMWEVQNVMSKHAYYHAAGLHLEELADIWVSETGAYAKTAKFSSPNWIMQGISTIKKAYGQANHENKVKELEAISKIYPDVENKPENLGAGHEWAMHTNTTPVIVVADDGKTAKGIWYSPGMGLSPRIQGESVSVGSTFFWEKYGADFVKENGEWKLWHCQMYYDFTPTLPASMTANLGTGGQTGEQGGAPGGQAPPSGGQGAPPVDRDSPPGDQGGEDALEAGTKMTGESEVGMRDNPVKYEPYSPTRVPEIMPRFPEPYYTFDETFSY